MKKGRQLETKGFVWTSTYESFVWFGSARATIILPATQSLEAYIDPVPHSMRYPCEGEKEGARLAHHQDVVLPPSVFVVDDAEGSKDDVRTAAWGVMHKVLSMLVEFGTKIESTSWRDEVWRVTTTDEDERNTVLEMLAHSNDQIRFLNKTLPMFEGAVEKSPTNDLLVLIYPNRMNFKVPVLRWVDKGTPHLPFIVEGENVCEV